MHEQRRGSDVEQLDLKQAYNDLRPRLLGYSRDAEDAYNLLGEMSGRTILFSECVQNAQAQLGTVAQEHVRTIKGQFCAQVYRSYPAGSEGSPELISPKRFIRENSLSSTIRPELRDAQAGAVADSKERLVAGVQEDETHDELGTGVSDEELKDSMVEEVKTRLVELRARIEEIKELMTIVYSPVGRVGSKVIGMVTHQGNVVTIPDVTRPAEPKQKAQLDGAIFALKKVLQELGDGETTIAHQLVEQHTPHVRDYLERNLITRYEELEVEELTRLPADVEAAYVAAANLGPSYRPKLPTPEAVPTATPLVPARNLEAPVAAEQRSTRTLEVKNPFAWCDDETISLTITQDGERTLVSTAAMTPNTRAISKKLRATDSQAAKKLDDMWERVKEVELNGEAQKHSLIRHIRANFHDLTLYYFKNNRRNGTRMYYTKTKLSQLPDLATIAHGAGATQDTDLVILLAETDKAHQSRVFPELNVHWRATSGR